jgi:hypothetical protein
MEEKMTYTPHPEDITKVNNKMKCRECRFAKIS